MSLVFIQHTTDFPPNIELHRCKKKTSSLTFSNRSNSFSCWFSGQNLLYTRTVFNFQSIQKNLLKSTFVFIETCTDPYNYIVAHQEKSQFFFYLEPSVVDQKIMNCSFKSLISLLAVQFAIASISRCVIKLSVLIVTLLSPSPLESRSVCGKIKIRTVFSQQN